MEFSAPRPRRRLEPALPMINVVFLLLIFFLMSAQIVTPPPFEVAPPAAEGTVQPVEEMRLHISAEGAVAVQDQEGEAAWQALTAIIEPSEVPLLIRADGQLDGVELARVLTRVTALGFTRVQLATVPR